MRIEGNAYTAFFGLDATSFQIGQNSNFRSITFHSGSGMPERMRILPSGNVGIGTSSPDAILDIEGNFETNYALKFTNTQGTGKVGGFRSHGTNGNDLTIYQDGARKQGWSSSEVKFYGTSNAEIMRIENGGNVGIGIATPALQSGGTGLHIHGSSASEIKLTNTTSGTGALNGVAFVTGGNSFTLNNSCLLYTSPSPRD